MKFISLLSMVSMAVASPMNPFNNGLIVGGESVQSGELPFQVSLQRSSHFCGAAIIDNQWIITAAHCVSGTSASSLKVRVGTTKHNSGGEIYQVQKVFSHPKYDSWTIDNDVALLKTSKAINLSGNIDAIPLVSASYNIEAKSPNNVIVSGWGYTRESGGSLPVDLLKVSVPVVSRTECNSKYNGQITEQMFCAGVPEGGKDACQGDSGGPVTVVDNGTRKLAGVVSWGYGCARPTHPGVYTNLAPLMDWILATKNAN